MFTFIDTIENLAFLNKEFLKKPYLGIDTEFRRTTKDNMKLALLQVNDGEEIYLIDCILIKNPKEHASFLLSDSVTKIFHSCKEDLEAIFAWTNIEMQNIFDTQIAHSFLSDDYSISYQALVKKTLGIFLDKQETRSNWMRRPLTDSQLKYAALDVEYLIHIYEEQKEILSRSSKISWLQEDIKKLINTTLHKPQNFLEIKRNLSRAEENELLRKMHQIIENIAKDNNINSTMFFSKKSQKHFLRLALLKGIDKACEEITAWRCELIRGDVLTLLK